MNLKKYIMSFYNICRGLVNIRELRYDNKIRRIIYDAGLQ